MISGRPDSSTTTTGMPAFFTRESPPRPRRRAPGPSGRPSSPRTASRRSRRRRRRRRRRRCRPSSSVTFVLPAGELLHRRENRRARGRRAALALPGDGPAAASGCRCRPRSAPATWMPAERARSGSALPSFFSSTSDSRTAWRATARCAAEPKLSMQPAVRHQACALGFISPIANFTRRMRRTASSMRAIGTSSCLHQALERRDELAVLLRHHHHVHAGVDRHLDRRCGSRRGAGRWRCSRR